MAKTILKQVVIILLMCGVLVLALAIVFYQYLPSNKVVPAKVTAYSTPSNRVAEITDGVTEKEFQSQNQTYELTDSDLQLFKSKKSYNPGKSDPFEEYNEISEMANSVNSTNANSTLETGVTETNSKGANVDENTTDYYYTSAGITKSTK